MTTNREVDISYDRTPPSLEELVSLFRPILTRTLYFDKVLAMKSSSPLSTDLFQAILSLKSATEAEQFFGDLLTAEEIEEFSKRWQTAQLLDQKVPYTKIQAQTGLSSTTVARISRWLNTGKGGYRLILDRSHHHTSPSRTKRRT